MKDLEQPINAHEDEIGCGLRGNVNLTMVYTNMQ